MDRRLFLFLFGGPTAAIVLAGQGALALPQRLALLASGHCSFCLGSSGVRSLAGMLGKPARLCDLCASFLRSLGEGRTRIPSPPVVTLPEHDGRAKSIAEWLAAPHSSESHGDEFAAELRRRLGDVREAPALRLPIAAGVVEALAESPSVVLVRLRVADLLANAGVKDAAAAHYALVASAYRHQGFHLKAIAMNQQVENLHSHPTHVHELADLYELVGMQDEAARSRRSASAPPVAACSFCGVGRELAPSFAVLDERLCQPCVTEAADLFESHRPE